jgi:integrase
MAIRRRNGIWHYRFKLDGREYSGTTSLAGTARNESGARQLEAEHRQALLEGRSPSRRVVIRQFIDAAREFLVWAKVEYRAHPNSYRRIATSLTSAKEFFGRCPVSTIYEREVEAYKFWRCTKHEVVDVTVRHDLHALSTFFQYAMKQHWTRENPIRKVQIPSDADAVRIHVISLEEEREYFKRAARNKNLCDLARLMRNQGMRPDEVLALRKADIDLELGQLKIASGKTKAARRTLDLTAESLSILTRRCQSQSVWVFPSDRKSGKHLVRMNGAHDTAVAKTKTRDALHFVLYDFRHTFATQMAQAGVDLATLAAILGHGSIRCVQKYVHPTAEHKQQAMRKFEESLLKMESGGTDLGASTANDSVSAFCPPSAPIEADFSPSRAIESDPGLDPKQLNSEGNKPKVWRRGPGSNRRIKVLQTSPLPLGYRALAGLPLFESNSLQTAVANPAGAGGRIGAGDGI